MYVKVFVYSVNINLLVDIGVILFVLLSRVYEIIKLKFVLFYID